MAVRQKKKQYVVCVRNEGYRVSLVLRRIYECLPDLDAEKRNLLRVIDESSEDYLYPSEMFVTIKLPAAAGKAFAVAK
jgi:hypothetical protein